MTEEEQKRQEKRQGRWAQKRARRKARQKSQKAKSFKKTAMERLQSMFKDGFGQKRSRDKITGADKERIYSKNTYLTYKRQFQYFFEWLKDRHPEAYTIDDARLCVDEYLQHLIDLDRSASAISTAKAGLAKVFKTEATQFIKTPPRTRAGIKRSRYEAVRDKHISAETEAKLARFTSATGLRRAEMKQVTAEDLVFKNGKAYFHVRRGTKGGKERFAEIIGVSDAETADLIKWIQSKQGQGKLFPRLHSHFDNHHYRATYAARLYKNYARDVKDIPHKEKYIMRKDRAGTVLDKSAMLYVSRNLGHNRIDVIAQSYLYQL